MAPRFSVSKTQLKFDGEKKSVVTFVVRCELAEHGVEMTHNLPNAFDVNPKRKVFFESSIVSVCYRPSARRITIKEPLFIKFTEKSVSGQATQNKQITVEIMLNNIRMVGALVSDKLSLQSEALECKVCYQPFSEDVEKSIPMILTQCGHTVCHDCVVNIFKANYSNNIPCPMCRQITTNVPIMLPKNYSLIEMIVERRKEGNYEKKRKKPMSYYSAVSNPNFPCFENPLHDATVYCTICKVDFCEECFISVHSAKIFSNHELINIDQKPSVYTLCSLHPDNLADSICRCDKCKDGSKLCCKECLRGTQHSSHREYIYNLRYVTEVSRRILTKFSQKMEKTRMELSMKLDDARECASSYDKNNTAYQSAVKTVSNHFDRWKRDTLVDLENFVNERKTEFDVQKNDIANDLQEILKTKKKIKVALEDPKELRDAKLLIDEGEEMYTLKPRVEINFNKLVLPPFDVIIKRNERSINNADSQQPTADSFRMSPPPLPPRTTSM